MIPFFRKLRRQFANDNKPIQYLRYAIGEIILVVIGILIALSINNSNHEKINSKVEHNILKEIANGLDEDLIDLNYNIAGHNKGLKSCDYWMKIINNKQVNTDSVSFYFWHLTRNYINIQNTSSYESLKSRGLELIKSDSLRLQIISLYEVNYKGLKNLEEEYDEMKFQKSYFKEINHLVSHYFIFNDVGEIESIQIPLNLGANEKKEFLSYLWKIRKNRKYILTYYFDVENKTRQLRINIGKIIARG